MKLLTRIPSWIKNKYVIALGIFAAILFFFDKNDLFTQMSRTRQLKDLEQSKEYYQQKIAAEKQELQNLVSDSLTLEKYARERYLMKRDNEDLFLVPEDQAKGK
jgi:cell division protein DivIC